jgi:amino acid adenylation domain-containing protein
MNLDIKNPDSRLTNIIEKIKPEVIITNSKFAERLRTIVTDNFIIVNIDEDKKEDAVEQTMLLTRLQSVIDTDPYCIINTSGSTGTPKGVVLNHRNFIDFTEWAIDVLKIAEDEIIGSLSPLYFDIYSFELCLLMAKGAKLVIIPEQLAPFPAKLIEFLDIKEINFIFWVPTIMVNIANLNLFAACKLSHLRKILFAGEVFPTKHLNYWRKFIPQAVFINLYGPIEITLDCTYYIVDREFPDDQPIPIGFPCRNTDILILTEDNRPVSVGQKGELCVRGASVALGYYNDPEKTAKAFVQNPLNNNYPELIYRTGDVVYKNEANEIIFVGRTDFQVKHQGYRIDLSEVEHIIVNTWGRVKNGCVLYSYKKKEICLIYEADKELSTADIRKELIQYMPKYMMPSIFYFLNEMPKNPNGKIDRNYLKETLLS